MKVLFIGLGSIGIRHLRNLAKYCAEREIELAVHAQRSSLKPLPEDVSALVSCTFPAVPEYEYYDAAFITNPTHLHAQAISSISARADALFIEKPIFEKLGYQLDELGISAGKKAYVAAPMRWTALYAALKEYLQAVKPYAVRSICSSFLPSWRPAADYRTVYSAKKEMGGGVTLDLIHEWDYLTGLFGYPDKSINMRGHFSDLEINSDDLSVYIARYPEFLLELHLDYFGKTYRRSIEVFCENGSVLADFGTGLLTLPDGTVQNYAEDANRRYEREIEYFVHYMQGVNNVNMNSPENAVEVLKIALGNS